MTVSITGLEDLSSLGLGDRECIESGLVLFPFWHLVRTIRLYEAFKNKIKIRIIYSYILLWGNDSDSLGMGVLAETAELDLFFSEEGELLWAWTKL